MEIKVGQTGTLFRLGSRKAMTWTIKGEPKMNPLYQLPNGQWIDVANVRAISATEGAYRTVIDGEPYPARVAVHLADGRIEIIETESWEECQKLRDRLATEVNERRAS